MMIIVKNIFTFFNSLPLLIFWNSWTLFSIIAMSLLFCLNFFNEEINGN